MATFPSLSDYDNMTVYRDSATQDLGMSVKTDSGPDITRARSTYMLSAFTVEHTAVATADKTTFWEFWEARAGSAESFTWTNAVNSVSYTVRFAPGIPEIKSHGSTDEFWIIKFSLREV